MTVPRALGRTVVALQVLCVLAVAGVLVDMRVTRHREEKAAEGRLAALVTRVRDRLTDGYRADGELPTVAQEISTPAVLSQSTAQAVVYARLHVDYTSTVLFSTTDSVDACHLFTLRRADGAVRVRDQKVSCTRSLTPQVEQAPRLTFAFMKGIPY